MAQLVNVPGVGQLSFPDGMSQDDMASAIQKNFPQMHTDAAGQVQTTETPSFLGQIGRQIGLTARAGVNGMASLPAMVSDAVTGPINAGLDLVRGEGNGFRLKKAAASIDDLMNAAGLPQPETRQERIVQSAASGMAGAGSMVGLGRGIAGIGGKVATGIGDALSAGPGLQTVSAGAGAGAADTVKENGGGAGAQMAAGLAGALAPSVLPAVGGAAVRGVLRGGDAGRQVAADNLAAFKAAGMDPTLGQVTGNRVVGAAESLLSKVPGSAGVMQGFANKQADDMATAVQNLSDELAPNASAVNAGDAITRGITAFKNGIKSIQNKLYSHLDDFIPADHPVRVSNTQDALAALNAEIPGAPNLSQFFINSKIKGIDSALQNDLEAAAKGGTLPFEALKKLRTLVGDEIGNNSLVSDVPRSKWMTLYGALSDDLGTAATAAGPEAAGAWQWANQFTKSQMARLEQLQGIIAKDSPEKIFNAAISGTAEGDTIAKRVISALPMRDRTEVAGALLQRLGRASPGAQNAMGDAFSTDTFLSNLSKLSPEARQTIFGRTDVDGVMDQLNQFAQVAAIRRAGGRIFNNPSGTAQAAAQIGVGSGIAGGVVSAGMGHPWPLVGALAVPAGAYVGAKAVTSQALREMAATPTTFNPGTAASLVSAAGDIPSDGLPSVTDYLTAQRSNPDPVQDTRRAQIAAEVARMNAMRANGISRP